MGDDKRRSRPFGVPILVEAQDPIAGLRDDLKTLSGKHDALAADFADTRVTVAATDAKVDILLELASDNRRAKARADTEDTKLERTRIVARTKLISLLIKAGITVIGAAAGWLFGKYLS